MIIPITPNGKILRLKKVRGKGDIVIRRMNNTPRATVPFKNKVKYKREKKVELD